MLKGLGSWGDSKYSALDSISYKVEIYFSASLAY